MFEIKCQNCGNKDIIDDANLNVGDDNGPEDCFTEIISKEGNFIVATTNSGMKIECKKCGNQIMEYNHPY